MAFFKFWRSESTTRDDKKSKPAGKAVRGSQAESVEAMRRRARNRLIGATVLVMVGVAGFPVLFDTRPRTVSVDIPIEIPDRNKVSPLAMPALGTSSGSGSTHASSATPGMAATALAPSAVAPQRPSSAPVRPPNTSFSVDTLSAPRPASGSQGLDADEEIVQSTKPPAKAAAATRAALVPKPAAAASARTERRAEPAVEVRPDEAARARALLDDKLPDAAAAPGRFVVQMGAFADVEKAREVRQKAEKAGLKTYTQVVDTKDGKRIRVRVGPFVNKADADKAAGRIRGLDLPATLLTL